MSLRQQDLTGKVAVVTGASRGIGRAITMNLASRGCSVLGTCSSSKNLGLFESINEEIETLYSSEHTRNSTLRGISADIFSHDCAQLIGDALAHHFSGRVDIFVNNAAYSGVGTIGELTVDEIQQSMIGNIQTPVLIVEELVKRQMFQPNGRIIYISSIRSRQPWSMQLMYSAGKSGGEALCRTWAQAFGGKEEKYAFMAGTTANSVTVGLTQTESVLNCPPDLLDEFKNEFLPLQSKPDFGRPEDVANVVGLLCSPDAIWITGSVISASGGGIKIG